MPYTKVTDNIFTSSFSSIIQTGEAKPVTTSIMTCIALSDELVFVDCGLQNSQQNFGKIRKKNSKEEPRTSF